MEAWLSIYHNIQLDLSPTFPFASDINSCLTLSSFGFISPPLQPLDHEKKPSFTLEVQVRNTQVDPRFTSSGSKYTATVRISVEDVDEPPLFDKDSYLMEVKEDAAVGTAVGSVRATDPDKARSVVR